VNPLDSAAESPVPLRYLPELPINKSPRIGCIGAGFIMADCHLVAYREAGFQPVAIVSKNPTRAREVADRHHLKAYDDTQTMLASEDLQVVDVAVPPDTQYEVIEQIVRSPRGVRGILAQKPLGVNFAQAREIVRLCDEAGIMLVVNQNMRYDQSIRACKSLLEQNVLGDPVFASIDMRAIPHWMPWQERQGWVTLRIMSIHHLDTFRYWFGNPKRVFASIRSDPRTAKRFAHRDGICLTILEYENEMRASSWDDVWAGPSREGAEPDIGIRWRVEGLQGMARGTIGWPEYPNRAPSTIDFTTCQFPGKWYQPRWPQVWFPDAFVGPMAELLRAMETGSEANLSGRDNLHTMALVDACYRSAEEHRAVEIDEIWNG
jgi:predicted dehydrogenase